jgi:hypothetical protein
LEKYFDIGAERARSRAALSREPLAPAGDFCGVASFVAVAGAGPLAAALFGAAFVPVVARADCLAAAFFGAAFVAGLLRAEEPPDSAT